MSDWIGYRWLAERHGVCPVQAWDVESCIGASRRTITNDGLTTQIYTANMRPEDTLAAHLTFAIKHEGVHLEFLARLFASLPAEEIAGWMRRERTGQYARRIGFLWEWLMGRPLEGVPDVTGGNYVNALDPQRVLCNPQARNHPRWRVRDNLPGNRHFCPTVRRSPAVIEAESYDCRQQLDALQAEYGTDILMRSAVWLTVKESRASFQIEHEDDKTDRIQRFAALMERRCGEEVRPLARETLADLQREVIGDKSTFSHFGLRLSPVFVGETAGFQEQVHYVAPPWERLDELLDGMEAFIERSAGASALARAAVVAFGFVYIHPLADGNGRIHRFLINDILRRDGAVPRPYILPISAAITHKPQDRARYDMILERFSRPLMARYGDAYRFEADTREYADGIWSNFVFSAYEDALPAWRYPDLTAHVEYLAALIDQTIRTEMKEEARLLRCWDQARRAVKNEIEGPNTHIDRIIRAVLGNGGRVSHKLVKEFAVLADASVAANVTQAIQEAFEASERDGKQGDEDTGAEA